VAKSILGSFYFGFNKNELYHIAEQVAPGFWLVECYDGLQLKCRKVYPTQKFQGFELYPDMQAALAAEIGGVR
jgi:hypothetical protein